MNPPVYLRNWLHHSPWMVRALLVFVTLSAVFQFGAFALSQNFVISYLAAQQEDVTFALQMTYVGILVMLPVQFRFQRYFEPRNYMIVILSCGIILAVACLFIQDIVLFFIIRFLQGLVVCGIASCMFVQVSPYLRTEHRQVIPSVLLYGSVLANTVIIGMIASNVSLTADFQHLYYYIILFLIISLVIIMTGFKSRTDRRPYPLWQIDWVGAVFFATAAVAFAYTVIYGSKFYWFTDRRIRLSSLITVVSVLLYVLREYMIKRPLIQVRTLLNPKIWLGLLLLAVYYGMKESINLIFGYTSSVLQWSPSQTMELGLFNLAGIIIFMVLSTGLLFRRPDIFPFFLVVGFGLLMVYHLWVYFVMTPDLAFGDLIVPVILQGAASGMMLVPIVVFIIRTATPAAGYTGLVIGAYARFTALLNASAGFYNLQLYYNQIYKESFLSRITGTDQQTAERIDAFKQLYLSKGYALEQATSLANAALGRLIGTQAQLLTIRAVFMQLAIIAGLIMMVAGIVWILVFVMKKANVSSGKN
ncbi:MFS transporter [Mucilaginibacter pallidiroseus]|uniref:MFS transporter n=1 Tax=Mucilaginibacter pallidiroseus TaxID=2599295 RepID=A0A563TZ40_9SPHI|nr:MFS transporter [Mucilaginibacter pallidiroseus]TWR24400.1 MFS transporter [Mucilaginibacter pallidiroseus]